MALTLKIQDPTDPSVEVDAYVRLVQVNKPRKGLSVGLHADFSLYRSKDAANAGAQAIAGMPLALDIGSGLYDKCYDYLFSPEALSQNGWNLDAVVYAFASKYAPAFAAATADLDANQAALDLGLPEDLDAEIMAIYQPQEPQP